MFPVQRVTLAIGRHSFTHYYRMELCAPRHWNGSKEKTNCLISSTTIQYGGLTSGSSLEQQGNISLKTIQEAKGVENTRILMQ